MQLLHGDCLELMKSIPDGSIDMVLCDPPYGTTACKWDSVIPFDKMWEQLNRVIKKGGVCLLFGSEPFSSALRMSNINNYRYDWKWDKIRGVGHLLADKRPMMCVEDIMVFYDSFLTYNPQMRYRDKPRKSENNGNDKVWGGDNKHFEGKTLDEKYPINLLRYSKSDMQSNNFHPTQKPVALLMYLIKTYTNEKEIVLDFTMGSGSTGVACKNTNRNFIGIEKDDKYFEIAKQRIENGFVQEDVNINENSPLFE